MLADSSTQIVFRLFYGVCQFGIWTSVESMKYCWRINQPLDWTCRHLQLRMCLSMCMCVWVCESWGQLLETNCWYVQKRCRKLVCLIRVSAALTNWTHFVYIAMITGKQMAAKRQPAEALTAQHKGLKQGSRDRVESESSPNRVDWSGVVWCRARCLLSVVGAKSQSRHCGNGQAPKTNQTHLQ